MARKGFMVAEYFANLAKGLKSKLFESVRNIMSGTWACVMILIVI